MSMSGGSKLSEIIVFQKEALVNERLRIADQEHDFSSLSETGTIARFRNWLYLRARFEKAYNLHAVFEFYRQLEQDITDQRVDEEGAIKRWKILNSLFVMVLTERRHPWFDKFRYGLKWAIVGGVVALLATIVLGNPITWFAWGGVLFWGLVSGVTCSFINPASKLNKFLQYLAWAAIGVGIGFLIGGPLLAITYGLIVPVARNILVDGFRNTLVFYAKFSKYIKENQIKFPRAPDASDGFFGTEQYRIRIPAMRMHMAAVEEKFINRTYSLSNPDSQAAIGHLSKFIQSIIPTSKKTERKREREQERDSTSDTLMDLKASYHQTARSGILFGHTPPAVAFEPAVTSLSESSSTSTARASVVSIFTAAQLHKYIAPEDKKGDKAEEKGENSEKRAEFINSVYRRGLRGG